MYCTNCKQILPFGHSKYTYLLIIHHANVKSNANRRCKSVFFLTIQLLKQVQMMEKTRRVTLLKEGSKPYNKAWVLISYYSFLGWQSILEGTVGKDKSCLSCLLTEEINHPAHLRIPFQAACWELHYTSCATYYYAYCDWLDIASNP